MVNKVCRWGTISLLLFPLVVNPGKAQASLIGPWFRFTCEKLGFQIPVATGWRMTEVPDGIVFAMQARPDPYVRVAVGRISAQDESVDDLIHAQRPGIRDLHRTECRVDGENAIQIEGRTEDGPFMDLFVKKASYWYWIGFAADNQQLWPQYVKTFNIVLDGFRFL